MDGSIVPFASVDDEDVERFRVMIDAKTRHADLWPLVKKLGSTKALAEAIGATQSLTGEWVNLKSSPSPEKHSKQLGVLHTLSGMTFEEMWPAALRKAIGEGKMAMRRDFMVETSMLQLASRATERLVLPDPADESSEKEVRELLSGQISGVLTVLDARSQQVVKMRFGLGEYEGRTHTYNEVAEALSFTRERARQIEIRSIFKLREQAKNLPVLKEIATSG